MLCDKCHKNEASLIIQEVVNGEKKEFHLCQSCAANDYIQFTFSSLMQGLFNNIVSNNILEKEKLNIELKKCSICGLTFQQISKNGKVGCSNCYNDFRAELTKIIKNIQGTTSHLGKFPIRSGADLIIDKKIKELKENLKLKIQMEEYEEAAKLRDEIKSLQGGVANE